MKPRILGCAAIALVANGSACARMAPVAQRIASQIATERPAGTIHEDAFSSDALGVRKHLVIYLPPSYGRDTTKRYPVAYYLHGLSGSETDWVSKGNIDGTADSLAAAGAPEMIIVMPDGDDGWYTNWVQQVPFATCADTLHVEAPDRYCVAHERYDEYIAYDVVRYIDAHYRTLADRAHRGIGGLSMGGYGALSVALHHPDVFAAAASHSGVVSPTYVGPHPFGEPARFATSLEELRSAGGAFWRRYQLFWGTELERWRAADPGQTAEALKRRGARIPALFFDCGREDGFVDQDRALHSELTRLGIPHSYAEWPGAHTWQYWSTHVSHSLAWMAMQIAH